MINYLSSTFAIGLGIAAGIAGHEISCRIVPREEAIALQDWAEYTGAETASFSPPTFALTWARALSARSLIVGALTAILFVAANNRYSLTEPAGLLLAYAMIFLCVTLALTDLFFYQLPDRLTQALLWLGLGGSIIGATIPPEQAIAGAMTGYAGLFLVSVFSSWWRGGESGLGEADKKFLAAVGAWVGINGLPAVIGWASILAALHLICHRSTDPSKTDHSATDPCYADHDHTNHAPAGDYCAVTGNTATECAGRDVPIPFGPAIGLAGLLTFLL